MNCKKIIAQLNISAQCKQYGLSLWQCPSFLFLIMGIIIIISTLTAYFFGTRYIENPEIVALIVLLSAVVLFIIAFIITRSFEKLAEVNRMKSEFVKIVTHQLRSPLVNLNWVVDILMSDKIEKTKQEQTEYFRILKDNSRRMADLIQDLLTITRIEEGSLAASIEDISLEDIIKKVILRFESFAVASNIKIAFEAQPNLPKISVDVHQIETAVENLLDNAIRYIKGRGEVKIKLEKRDKNLYFEIKDSGLGISPKDQKYIFQKFFRSDSAIKKQTQGSGLGLFITKSIIERFGGEIGFSSQEDKGSTFWFTLPFK